MTRWQTTPAAETDLTRKLMRSRGWLKATMRELELGVDRGRITIPVRADTRRLVGLRRCQPWLDPGEPKMLAAPGSRRALLPRGSETHDEVAYADGQTTARCFCSEGSLGLFARGRAFFGTTLSWSLAATATHPRGAAGREPRRVWPVATSSPASAWTRT
jgi:hypothetical protein